MLARADGHVFVGKRIDNQEGDWWQMPQGGVDPGEDLAEAAFRELHEETGIKHKHLTIVGQMAGEVFYDLPDDLRGKLWGGKYLGQRQTWFLLRFSGEDRHVDLNAHKHPEFCAFKWVLPELLPELIVPFKREVYQRVVAGLTPLL